MQQYCLVVQFGYLCIVITRSSDMNPFLRVPGIKFAGSCGRRGGKEATEILIVTYLCLIFVDTSLIFSILLSLKPQSPQGKFYLWLLFVHSLGLNALVSKELWACGCVWGLCAEELEFIMGGKTTEGNFHLAKLHPVTCTTIIRFSLELLRRNRSEMGMMQVLGEPLSGYVIGGYLLQFFNR